MVLQTVPDVARYGSVTIEAEGRVTEFVEKGTRAGAGLINAGIYLLRKEIVAALPAGEADFAGKRCFPGAASAARSTALVSEGLFIDIGDPGRFGTRANGALRAQRARTSADGRALLRGWRQFSQQGVGGRSCRCRFAGTTLGIRSSPAPCRQAAFLRNAASAAWSRATRYRPSVTTAWIVLPIASSGIGSATASSTAGCATMTASISPSSTR